MEKPRGNFVLRNVANIVSILGMLPLCILFGENGYQYLILLIVYNNIMDDLDGIVAAKLDIKSEFGAALDNVCDAISHSIFVLAIGMHCFWQSDHPFVEFACVAGSLLATVAIILRVVTRLDPTSTTGTGSPTNEMIRHIFFVIILSQIFEFDPSPLLMVVFWMHVVTMLVPFRMPYLIRSLTKSTVAIGLVNVALVLAWWFPTTAPIIVASFIGTYFVSFLAGGIDWLKKADSRTSP
jgi:phosphatidylserine synthase